jgi:predicted MFS family arabinose efflux permease
MMRKSFFIFPILAAVFCFSMFYRVTNAVIAPDLVRDFNLDAERLGVLGSAFFYAFALFQIPIGVLLDRVGPRRVMSFFTLVGAAGALWFAAAGNYSTACLGRVLLGIGMASALMGSLKVFVIRYAPQRFATLSGTIIAIGTAGTLAAASPLAYLNSLIGWRLTLFLCGSITAALAVLLFWVLRERGDSDKGSAAVLHASYPQHQKGFIESVRMILGNLSFWQISSLAFFRYGTFVALQGVWFGPYLMSVKGYTPVTAGNILTTLSVGMAIGSSVAGHLADRVFRTTKSVLLLGLSCYAVCLFLLTGVVPLEGILAFSVLFMLLGFFNGFGMLGYAHIKELFPLSMSGTVITGVNFFLMAGGAVFMQVIGVIIEFATRGGTGQGGSYPYHLAFFVCFIGMLASLIFYFFSKSTADAEQHQKCEDSIM